MSEWKDIATAPKDEKVILISDGKAVVAAYWSLAPRAYGGDREYPWVFLDETNGVNGWMDNSQYGPTHWMPLPEPPATGSTDSGNPEPVNGATK